MKNSIPFLSGFTMSILLLFVLSIFSSDAQTFQFERKRKKYTMNFQTAQNLIIIPVYLNGKGPYNFLLDTGVGPMIITDTTFLKTYPLKEFKTVKLQGYGFGKEIEAIFTQDITAQIGKTTLHHIPTAIFTKDLFDLSSYLGVHIYGIIGYYLFNSFLVRINYSRNRITFYDPESAVKIKGTKIPMQIRNSKPYIKAEIQTAGAETKELDFLIDNGSSHPLLLESMNQAPFPLPPTTIPANLGVGINGVINGVMGRVSVLNLGNYTFKDVLCGFPEYNKQLAKLGGNTRNGSIGADILKHFTITFDYQHAAVYLKQTHTSDTKFEHDMSGMEIYMLDDQKPRYFIGRIEPGSPAEQSGFQVNDELLSIDFKSVHIYTLSELTSMLKSRDGRRLIIEVGRKDKTNLLLLQLKRRI